MPTLNTSDDFELAVETAQQLAERLASADVSEAEKLDHLLSRIAEYQQSQPPTVQAVNREKLSALDEHLRAFGRRWPNVGEGQDEHWSPMLGGDPDHGHGR